MMGAASNDAANNGAWSLIRKSRLNQTMLDVCVIVFAVFWWGDEGVWQYLFIGFCAIIKIIIVYMICQCSADDITDMV